MSPTVSVVMPCYNHAGYVRAAVESALSQSCSDVEIIAIDDCSSDDTATVLETIDDPRLTVIRHEKNRGSAETINEGIRRSKAPYVSILNSDDLYHPQRFERCLEFMRNNSDALLLGTDLEVIDGRGERDRDRNSNWIDWYRDLKQAYRLSGDIVATLITGNLFITTSNFFFRRTLFESVGPLADYRYVQDYEFLLRTAAAHPHQLHWIDERLLSYRIHSSNTIRDDHLAPNKQTLEILAHWVPDLAVGERAAARLRQFETHVLKLADYIESASTTDVITRWQTDAQNYRNQLEQKEQELSSMQTYLDTGYPAARDELARTQAHITELESKLTKANETYAELKKSNDVLWKHFRKLENINKIREESVKQILQSASYRLGHALLQPIRWLERHSLRLFRGASTHNDP